MVPLALTTALLLAAPAEPPTRAPYAALALEDLPELTQFRPSRPALPVRLPGPLTTRLLARDAVSAVVAPDGVSLFVANGSRGSRIITVATNERWRLPASYVREATFSPTGQRLAVIDEDQSLLIYGLADGKLERRVVGHFVKLGFASPNLLALYDGCTLTGLDVTTDEPPRPLAPTPCGDAQVTADGQLWLIAERDSPDGAGEPGFRALYLFDAPTRSLSLLLVATPADPILGVRLVGERFLCFTRRGPAGSEAALYCVGLANRVAQLITPGPVARIVADDGRSQLAFTDVSRAAAQALWVVNLDNWSLSQLGAVSASGFRFLPGGRRLATWRGPDGGATVYDLAGPFQMRIAPADEGVTSLTSVPGTDRRVLVARQRKEITELVEIDGLPE